MNWDRIENNWKYFKGNAKQRWNKLTDDQLDATAGKRDLLAITIRLSYDFPLGIAEKQIADWQSRQKEIGRPV